MLNELEKDKLRLLAEDDFTLNALHKLFQSVIENLEINPELKNERIGELWRAQNDAKEIIDLGMKELLKLKKGGELKPKINEAR